MGTVGGPLLYCYLTHDLHILTVYIWIILRLHQAVDAHSGYGKTTRSLVPIRIFVDTCAPDFPWSLHNFLPFWSGAEHHDFHHMAFTNVQYYT